MAFISKTEGRDITVPNPFRPISLTLFLLKTVEKLWTTTLRVLENDSLHPKQHAYRAGRYTEITLAGLTGIHRKSLDEKEIVVCVFNI